MKMGQQTTHKGELHGLTADATKRLQTVWSSIGITTTTEFKVYESLVLSVLMYNAETWTVTADAQRKLSVFEMDCSRRIAGVIRKDEIQTSKPH